MWLRKRCAAGDAQNLAADVARLLGGEEDVRRRQLGRLSRASYGELRGAELRDLLGGHGGRNQWRPHRPRCHRVDPDSLRFEVLGKPLREGDDGALGGGVVERSEEHTSELQSRQYLVCRLLLEKKKTNIYTY